MNKRIKYACMHYMDGFAVDNLLLFRHGIENRNNDICPLQSSRFDLCVLVILGGAQPFFVSLESIAKHLKLYNDIYTMVKRP